jgi:hypothetical protein
MPATVGIGNMVVAGKARSYGRARGVHEAVSVVDQQDQQDESDQQDQ